MLNLKHPQAPYVVGASRQLDLVLDYCKRISLSDVDSRRFMMEVIRPAFAALRWLAGHHFADAPHIPGRIDELERLAEQLVKLPLRESAHHGGKAARCPACGGKPTAPSKYDPISFCSTCLDIIMPGLRRVESYEEGFGTDAI